MAANSTPTIASLIILALARPKTIASEVLQLIQICEQKLTRAKSINAALFIKNWSTAKVKKLFLIVTFQKRDVLLENARRKLLIFPLKLQLSETVTTRRKHQTRLLTIKNQKRLTMSTTLEMETRRSLLEAFLESLLLQSSLLLFSTSKRRNETTKDQNIQRAQLLSKLEKKSNDELAEFHD
ncbi:unnamed protein product [Oikopleura dioica]|uniref:Uncharacterized protein n=1 Tax=Oikopleura dioica TaxID=34765 RepID=E4YSI4_OIKDI|nr:unnamed protein product [Oikopleura dioica]